MTGKSKATDGADELLRALEYHRSSSENGICKVPRETITRVIASLAALPPPTGEPVAWEFLAADGSWKPCRNERDAAMWAEDGRKIRPVPGTIR